jgi:hypothetical protein
MACNKDFPKIRTRIGQVLKTNACSQIRFRLANISIGRFMFNYIAGMIENGSVNIGEGDTPHYDIDSNTLLISGGATEAEIVHESTHIVINATHKGMIIRRGDHETAAYLAAALWALNSDNEIAVDVPHMDVWVRRLANKVLAYNKANLSGTFSCNPADYLHIQTLMRDSRNGTDIDERREQKGLSLCEN